MTMTTTRSIPETVTTWQIDPGLSRASFAVHKRLFFMRRLTVEGRFAGAAGTIALDPTAPEHSRVTAAIQTAGLDTRNRRRDKHLRGPDFFDVDRYPTITFQSRAITPLDPAAGHYRITGDLTVRDVTRTVDLDTRVGPESDPSAERLQFTATTTLNRHDFGLHWSSPLITIADEVVVTLEIDAVRQ